MVAETAAEKRKCPLHPIEIPDDREVVDCDRLSFSWKHDPNGYFLVKLDTDNKQICCGFVNKNHKMILELRAKEPDKIIKEIAKRRLVGLEHMGYIASELIIAKHYLDNGKKYVQR